MLHDATSVRRALLRSLLVGALLATAPLSMIARLAPANAGMAAADRKCSRNHIVIVPALEIVGIESSVNGFGSGDGDGVRGNAIPNRMFLDQNYPNPFNPSTLIRFGLPEATNVKLTIHNLLGNQVKVVIDSYEDPGVYTVNLAAQDLPSGVYFYRLQTDYGTLTRRMTLSK